MKSSVAQLFTNAAGVCVNAAAWAVTRITTERTGLPVVDGVVRTSFSFAATVYEAVMVGSLHTLAKLHERVSTFRNGSTQKTFRSCSTDA